MNAETDGRIRSGSDELQRDDLVSASSCLGASMGVDQFWAPWEVVVENYGEASDRIHDVFSKWSKRGRVLAWRGQTDASWPLHSPLYRRLLWSSGGSGAPQEADLATAERRILADVHRWGLHMGAYGRLSVMGQLAVLQHFGAPTRLIDITFNPWIGMWFAVHPRTEADGEPADARLFVFDVTDRLISEKDEEHRFWEDDLHVPWPRPAGPKSKRKERDRYREWSTSVLAWRPPQFHPRLSAQNGGFLLGGVPATGVVVWPKTTSPTSDRWSIAEVRQATSVSMRVHKLGAEGGGPSADAMYTIRIRAEAIAGVRKCLDDLFGYRQSTLFPDYAGFADFGTPYLRTTLPGS